MSEAPGTNVSLAAHDSALSKKSNCADEILKQSLKTKEDLQIGSRSHKDQ